MRIKSFSKLVEVSELHPLALQDTTVLVDGSNFFFDTYSESGLQYKLGCECQRYANYLKKYLSMFTKANIKCYFLFRGGHKDQYLEWRRNVVRDIRTSSPIFMYNVIREVLHQMGFQYVTCEYDCKKDLIALAQTLDWPVISFDVEYCFAGIRYIPRNQLRFNENNNTIDCRYFSLENFMEKHNVNARKLALFIVLLDEKIFPEDFFYSFYRHIGANLGCFKRNARVLEWLSVNDVASLKLLLRFLSAEERQKFDDEVAKAESMIGRQEEGGLAAACVQDPSACAVAPGDTRWFEKGLAINRIPASYVNLYRNKVFFNNQASNQGNQIPVYLEIVKYMFDLLTDFRNEGFTFVYDTDYSDSGRESVIVGESYSVRKPRYDARDCVFENGWDAVRDLGLVDHFFKETLQLQDLGCLDTIPDDARLLLTGLVYFSRKTNVDMSAEAASVLLSYITLSIILENCDKAKLPSPPFAIRPVLEPTTDKTSVTVEDCNTAAAIMAGSLTSGDDQLDRAALDSLIAVQQCLSEVSALNRLCGDPWRPTEYSRTFSGSLVYRLRRAADGDARSFFERLLAPAPTVYAFFSGLMGVYEQMIS